MLRLSDCENLFATNLTAYPQFDNYGPQLLGAATKQLSTAAELSNRQPFISPLQFGLCFGFILSLLYKFRPTLRSKDEFDPFKELHLIVQFLHWKNRDYSKLVYTTICFVGFLMLLPLLSILWVGAAVYRKSVHYNIKKKYGGHFKGFLDGTDAVWALEEDVAKSVINIMTVLEIKDTSITKTTKNISAIVLLALRKRLATRLLGDYKPFPKMFYKRMQENGYFFWTDENQLDIEDYIRFMPEMDLEKFGNDKEKIQHAFGSLSNQELPCNHTASWEILVSKQHIRNFEENTTQVPILFRIHHSLGDGVALLRLFLETVADKETPKRDYWYYCSKARPNLRVHLKRNMSFVQKSTFFLWNLKLSTVYRSYFNLRKTLRIALRKIQIFITSPASLVNQMAYQKVDENAIHSAKLSGDKIISWHFETKEDGNLLSTIKSIKRHFDDARFSDVFLSALSITLEKYFQSKNEMVPANMSVIIPARIEAEAPKLILHNKFSVAIQNLPIASNTKIKNKLTKFYNKILDVSKNSRILYNSPDYVVNYWLMSTLTALLPASKLEVFTESKHSTMAISNLPGPLHITKVQGFEIKNITFWLPNRGSTGIGISILSYGCKLQFGIIADKAVISDVQDADFILENTFKEIQNMASMTKQNIKRNSAGDIMRPYNV